MCIEHYSGCTIRLFQSIRFGLKPLQHQTSLCLILVYGYSNINKRRVCWVQGYRLLLLIPSEEQGHDNFDDGLRLNKHLHLQPTRKMVSYTNILNKRGFIYTSKAFYIYTAFALYKAQVQQMNVQACGRVCGKQKSTDIMSEMDREFVRDGDEEG